MSDEIIVDRQPQILEAHISTICSDELKLYKIQAKACNLQVGKMKCILTHEYKNKIHQKVKVLHNLKT